MISAESENKSIELVFPRPKREMDVYFPKMKGEDFFQMFSIDVQSVAKLFSEYEMDSIELKIENIINSPQTTKLILGSKGENGSASSTQ
ncbi:MAG TPA: hypothetical protein VI278_08905 [Nitrososphaeraceae archaeon]